MSDLVRGHSSATLLEAGPAAAAALDYRIRSSWPGARLVGTAFTVQGAGGDNLALHRAVLAAAPCDVLVVDTAGAPFGHWGEVLTVAAQARGIAGLLIDGGVRDTAEMASLDFPAFARHIAITGTRKDFPGVFGRTVNVGGVAIEPGDVIVGDADGVVRITHDRVEQTVDAADTRVADEEAMMAKLRDGARTIDLYAFGEPYREETC